MNILKRFVAGLGQQTAPFGFAPDDPEAGYKAGLGYIGDVGANILANNQGGVNPWANLGASMLQAKDSSTQRNKEAYTAQRLIEKLRGRADGVDLKRVRPVGPDDGIAERLKLPIRAIVRRGVRRRARDVIQRRAAFLVELAFRGEDGEHGAGKVFRGIRAAHNGGSS